MHQSLFFLQKKTGRKHIIILVSEKVNNDLTKLPQFGTWYAKKRKGQHLPLRRLPTYTCRDLPSTIMCNSGLQVWRTGKELLCKDFPSFFFLIIFFSIFFLKFWNAITWALLDHLHANIGMPQTFDNITKLFNIIWFEAWLKINKQEINNSNNKRRHCKER